MTSRKCRYSSKSSDESSRRRLDRVACAVGAKEVSRDYPRRQASETLETRQFLAGPRLIGIRPNEGSLIEQGTTLDTGSRSLVFRFDQGHQIDPQRLDAIRITRGGPAGRFDTADEVKVVPGAVGLGDATDDEVTARNLPLSNPEPAAEPEPESKNRDVLRVSGAEIMRPNETSQLDWGTDEPPESSPEGVDEALSLLFDEAHLDEAHLD